MGSTSLTAERLAIGRVLPWLPVIVGLLALYVPTIVDLARGPWDTEEQGHGPMVLAISLWAAWRNRRFFQEPGTPALMPGVIVLAFGLFVYFAGRTLGVTFLQVSSAFPVLIGVLLVGGGGKLVRALAFPIGFLTFMVPLPGVLIDAVTGPLKQNVSIIAESLLYVAGYPISRSGVTLTIGPYQLLVADACSGLHSMYSLGAVGVLYVYLMRYESFWRNAILVASILPIAFAANIIRVMTLVLVTYHLGDEAGQGFLHGFAGMILFVIALVLVFAIDMFLGLVFKSDGGKRALA